MERNTEILIKKKKNVPCLWRRMESLKASAHTARLCKQQRYIKRDINSSKSLSFSK